MKIAIFESITTPGGHEVDFDRILVDELTALGHEVSLHVPEQFTFNYDYKVPIRYLKGKGISYTGISGWRKILCSTRREINRQSWYKQLFQRAVQGEMDAIIIPTSTYRYLRALNMNILKKSPIPVVFILHGINPKEAPAFYQQVEKLKPYPNVKMAVLTFGDTVLGKVFSNVHCINPPAYIPRDIAYKPEVGAINEAHPLKLGFFGQYRREKRLDDFLDAFLARTYKHPVQLLVQGATMKPEDSADFERIIHKYSEHKQIAFLHKGLFGDEWQKAIAGVDVLLMPYSAERYRYHWAGMLFTAIGYQKPVILSSEINPEVLQEYTVGMCFQTGNQESLTKTVEEFINTFPGKSALYVKELARAAAMFSPQRFAENIAALCR